MWRLVVLLLLPVSAFAETYYLVHVTDNQVRKDGFGYNVTVSFHNNGGKTADCTVEEGNRTQQFRIAPYGDDTAEFRQISNLTTPRFGCEEAH